MISNWVLETFETWLQQIDDTEVIGQMVAKCKTRAAQIVQKERIEEYGALMETYKSCKPGDVLHLIHPWRTPKNRTVTKLKFWEWMPRTHRLFCDDPDNPKTNVVCLELNDIRHYQPSRCEARLRPRRK